MDNVLISGTSSGIGFALAQLHLDRGDYVVGISRRVPALVDRHDRYIHLKCDLTEFDILRESLLSVIDWAKIGGNFTTIYVNAGVFGPSPARSELIGVQAVRSVLDVNVLGVKVILDVCLSRKTRPRNVMASASISAIRRRAGMSAYAMSKAALNTLLKIYQLENDDVFFAVLGLCNVDTPLSRNAISGISEDLAELSTLRERLADSAYTCSARKRALDIVCVLEHRQQLNLISGDFYEIRNLLQSLASANECATV